jgi:uncharacterized membrane protein YGL010W
MRRRRPAFIPQSHESRFVISSMIGAVAVGFIMQFGKDQHTSINKRTPTRVTTMVGANLIAAGVRGAIVGHRRIITGLA